jgi:signal transduction histidine kinase
MMAKSKSEKESSGEVVTVKGVGLLFLANFVHQVVNPLNGVIGTLDNIVDGTYNDAKAAKKVNACRAQLEQCVTLIRNLAYLSDFFFDASEKEELRGIRENATSILPQVIIESIQFFQIAAARKGMKIELTDSTYQYRIAARPELLKQIFINLFDNWLKYGQQNQTIRVTSKINKRKELTIELVGISIGFSNNDSDNIFKMGFRSNEALGKVAQGSGIGLFVCKQITEKVLGGKIGASHKIKTGETTFRIAIPREKWEL